jgi:hypothetical protein
MTKILKSVAATLLGTLLLISTGLAQDVTTEILENAQDYSAVFFRMNEQVYRSFESKGLAIPFP